VYVTVEFYGIARARAGTPTAVVELEQEPAVLSHVLQALASSHPDFARSSIENGELVSSVIANLDGQRFVRSAQEPLGAARTVLFLSADAGG
jgi:molybdopterin converting factor small subunit